MGKPSQGVRFDVCSRGFKKQQRTTRAPSTSLHCPIFTANMSGRIPLLFQLCLVFFTVLARAAAQEPLVDERPIYRAGDAIPVTCRKYIDSLHLSMSKVHLLTCPSEQNIRHRRACKQHLHLDSRPAQLTHCNRSRMPQDSFNMCPSPCAMRPDDR